MYYRLSKISRPMQKINLEGISKPYVMTKAENTHQMNSACSLHNVESNDNTLFEINHNRMELQSGQTGLLQSKSPPCSMSLDYPKSSGGSVSQLSSTKGTDALQSQMKD